jgi:hypothetical protein
MGPFTHPADVAEIVAAAVAGHTRV